jgi:hypothetical protein
LTRSSYFIVSREYLAAAGYDPSSGARPLKRVIQKELEITCGHSLLKGDVKDGQMIVVDCDRAKSELTLSLCWCSKEGEIWTVWSVGVQPKAAMVQRLERVTA